MKYLLFLIILALVSCGTTKPVTQYYIGFHRTDKATLIKAIPVGGDTTRFVILQTIDLSEVKQ